MTKSQERRIANELVFKSRNENSKRMALDVLDHESRATYKLNFVCECSNEHCTEPLALTVIEYLNSRRNERQFLLKPGHQQSDIETVIRNEVITVVEKFELPMTIDGRLKPSR
jgi:hypothetical protein